MTRYSRDELDKMAVADLLNDARAAEKQAKTGPFYPGLQITAERLLAYAATCRAMAKLYGDGGAHGAVICGELRKSLHLKDEKS